MIELLLLYLIFSFSANGLGKLYLFLIRRGQILGFMQKPLRYLQDRKGPLGVFIYKSIGGCDTCVIQRFADVAFFVMIYLSPVSLHWFLWLFIYCMFGGMVFYASAVTDRSEPIKKTTQKIEL